MRRSSLPALSLSALFAVGCGGYGQTVSNPCVPPTESSYSPTVVYDILPNASFEVPPTEANPWYGITSDGAGTYHLEWSDPLGAATCFTGLVTVTHAFATMPMAGDATTVTINDPEQLAFSGVPGSDTDSVDFFAGDDVVNVEAYIDVADTVIDFYYTDNSSGSITLTDSNIAGFQSP